MGSAFVSGLGVMVFNGILRLLMGRRIMEAYYGLPVYCK